MDFGDPACLKAMYRPNLSKKSVSPFQVGRLAAVEPAGSEVAPIPPKSFVRCDLTILQTEAPLCQWTPQAALLLFTLAFIMSSWNMVCRKQLTTVSDVAKVDD
jgi:hypothetical protein